MNLPSVQRSFDIGLIALTFSAASGPSPRTGRNKVARDEGSQNAGTFARYGPSSGRPSEGNSAEMDTVTSTAIGIALYSMPLRSERGERNSCATCGNKMREVGQTGTG